MSAWYARTRAWIMQEHQNGLDRLYATLLLDALENLKRQDNSPAYRNAMYWFYEPDRTVLSLRTVCFQLGLDVEDVQRCAARIEAEEIHARMSVDVRNAVSQ